MTGDGLAGANINMNLDRLMRVNVDGLHEPARAISSNRNQRQVKTSKARSDLLKHRAISRVAGKINGPARAPHHPPAPMRAITVEWGPRGKMLGRHAMDFNSFGQARGLPPIHLLTALEPPSLKPACESRWQRIVRTVAQMIYREFVEMIIMAVTDKNVVNGRKLVNHQAGRRHRQAD